MVVLPVALLYAPWRGLAFAHTQIRARGRSAPRSPLPSSLHRDVVLSALTRALVNA